MHHSGTPPPTLGLRQAHPGCAPLKTTRTPDGTPPTNHKCDRKHTIQRASSHFGNAPLQVRKAHEVLVRPRLLVCVRYDTRHSGIRSPGPLLTQTYGDFEMRLEADERVMAYVRTLGRARAYVVLNFTADVVELPIDEQGWGLLPLAAANGDVEGEGDELELVLCNYPNAEAEETDAEAETTLGSGKTMRGYEARVYLQTTKPLRN
ncbi:hypothetical protein JVT61DRAFT_6891 [Boletus reticuloceps]|uniref:Uncharacterized protein n=1 Tax=Boletus reticuloceps TaxID=495285 RepID=A0A8I2YJ54_9AGAM|nr:hypothetical protein JVT61DRAFT_6891 [Boletus reticuloceps]